jgi:ABC-type transport system involved in Fe-S cluster assembly fused permease/ATPase subunit
LLLRFYEPASGSIQVNESQRIDEIDVESYRQQIAVVGQEPVRLFVIDALEIRRSVYILGSLCHNHPGKHSIWE